MLNSHLFLVLLKGYFKLFSIEEVATNPIILMISIINFDQDILSHHNIYVFC